MDDDELARIRNKEIGFVFQTFNLLPRATALHNVELPLIYAGMSSAGARGKGQEGAARGGSGKAHASQAQRAVGRPAAARGRRAGAGEQSVDPAGRRAHRQPRHRDRQRNHGLFARLHEQGNTIVLVTHEHDIAMHAHRIIHIRDGKVERDEKVR